MKRIPVIFLLLCAWVIGCVAQGEQKTEPKPSVLIEVTQTASVPHSFQKLEQASVYGGFRFLPGWPRPGEAPVGAVRVRPRVENGEVKVKISVLRGTAFDKEEIVEDRVLSEKTFVVDALKSVGIEPFRLRLVPVPTTIAALPAVLNNTRSLIATVEPVAAELPSFKLRVLNSSAKPVIGIAYVTFAAGRTRLIASPRAGKTALIDVGQSFEATLPYPLKAVTEPVNDGPVVEAGAELRLQSVVFADGSYEGDEGPAARILAPKLGEKIQLTRILTLLRSDSAENKTEFARRVEGLSSAIDGEDLDAILKIFPNLTPAERDFAQRAAENGAEGIQTNFKKSFGKQSSTADELFAPAVKAAIVKCENAIASLP